MEGEAIDHGDRVSVHLPYVNGAGEEELRSVEAVLQGKRGERVILALVEDREIVIEVPATAEYLHRSGD